MPEPDRQTDGTAPTGNGLLGRADPLAFGLVVCWLVLRGDTARELGLTLGRQKGLVFVCLHPTEAYHLDILRELCERFVFVAEGRAWEVPSFAGLQADARARAYLAGAVAPAADG